MLSYSSAAFTHPAIRVDGRLRLLASTLQACPPISINLEVLYASVQDDIRDAGSARMIFSRLLPLVTNGNVVVKD